MLFNSCPDDPVDVESEGATTAQKTAVDGDQLAILQTNCAPTLSTSTGSWFIPDIKVIWSPKIINSGSTVLKFCFHIRDLEIVL